MPLPLLLHDSPVSCDRMEQYFRCMGDLPFVKTTSLQDVSGSEDLFHSQLRRTLSDLILVTPQTTKHFTKTSQLSDAFHVNQMKIHFPSKRTRHKMNFESTNDPIDIASLILLQLLLLSGDVELNPGPSKFI